jgi:ABC-2 type transport system permease protein
VKKAWIVARHEFTVTVKRVWFVIATFVLPLLMLGFGVTLTFIAHQEVEEKEREQRGLPLGTLDQWGHLSRSPSFVHLRFEDEKEAQAALRAKTISAYVVVPPDYLETGRVRVVTGRRPTLFTQAHERMIVPPGLATWLVENVLENVDEKRVARAKDPMKLETVFFDIETTQVSTEDPMETLKRSGVAYCFFLLMFFSILAASGYLIQGLAEEKENRVMEMVLSSVTPGELMLGKLVGLGAAGLLQLAIWVTMGVVGAAAFAVQIVLEPGLFAFCLIYFLLGYVLYGSLMLGFGSLGTNFRESQQLSSIWATIAVSPLLILVALVEAPQGTLARIFSYVPFTAPTTMMFRYAIDRAKTPVLDIVASMLILVAATFVAVRLSARLYRAGLLLYGKRPGFREVWRWMVMGK